VGNAWTKKAQADVVGINSMEKTLILGECKWSPKVMDRDVLESLVQKTEEFVASEGHWRIYYLGFARGGWTHEAKSFAETFGKSKAPEERWHAVGMSLLDLVQVDQDLADWSKGKDAEVVIEI
jgi:hypothetical protein